MNKNISTPIVFIIIVLVVLIGTIIISQYGFVSEVWQNIFPKSLSGNNTELSDKQLLLTFP